MLLIGPQVAFQKEKLQQQYPDVPVEAISMMDYGMMNGKAVLDHVRKVLEG